MGSEKHRFPQIPLINPNNVTEHLVNAMSHPHLIENCKKLMHDMDEWIIPDVINKWQDVPKEKPMSIITDKENRVALMAHFGQLQQTSEEWITINMFDEELQEKLKLLASKYGVNAYLETPVNVVFKFVSCKSRLKLHAIIRYECMLMIYVVIGIETAEDTSLGLNNLTSVDERVTGMMAAVRTYVAGRLAEHGWTR